MWQTKDEWAASLTQGKRYAERWCAVRLYPELRLRAALARLLATKPAEPLEPGLDLPTVRRHPRAGRQPLPSNRLETGSGVYNGGRGRCLLLLAGVDSAA
ncbi:hypothetical protein [Stenotrophomonas sp.]|uniref:hypothetical protein n=1 Tax=Stenotrophomonas sp. TaxID=69392 RepID=UPI003D0E349C